MKKNEILKYKVLNELAEQDGIVIFGSGDDVDVPLCELKQAFSIDAKLYNRSFSNLSLEDAREAYDTCVAPIHPETVLLHIGSEDMACFAENASAFEQKYRELIAHIRNSNKKCRIVVISLKNYENDAAVAQLNKHLEYIADSEKCEFGDIASRRVWNPRSSMETASFLQNMGIMRPRRNQRPVNDLVRMIFCYGN